MHPDEDYIPNHLITNQFQEGDHDQLTGWTSETDMDYTTLDESEASFHTMSTIQSIEAADYFLFVHGFLYESDESVPRLFPSDASLDKRDLLLHMIFRLARGGTNVPPIVDQMLRSGGVDANRGAPKVLEIVTNSGAWVQEMAEIYPTTTLVSIDTKPLIAHKPHARIAYEVYDMCAGILEPECSFDLVYTKHTALTKDFNGLLREICRVLKPNGFLLMDVLPLDAYEGEDPGIPLHSAPQFAEGLRLLRAVWEKQGSDIGIWDDLGSRLDPAHPIWQNSQSLAPDPQGDATYPTRGFHSVNLKTTAVPVGTWSNDERGRVLGELMRVFTGIAWRNFPPAMLMNGTEENEAQSLITGILQELRDIDRCKAYHKCQLWCAQKI